MSTFPVNRPLRRVLQIAQVDALTLLAVAGPAAVVAACSADWYGAGIGAGVALCGWVEWTGQAQLRRRDLRGILRLCSAQVGCLGLILLYAWHLACVPQSDRLLALLPAVTREQLALLLPDPAALHDWLTALQRVTAALIAAVSIGCQGGLALYYLRARTALVTEFAAPPVLPHDG